MIKRTLYFGNPAYLSLDNQRLVVTKPSDDGSSGEESRRFIAVEDIGVVVLDNRQITVTSGLMSALLDNNVAVVTCNEKCMPTGLLMPLDANTVQNERFRSQLDASLPLKKQLWQQTIECKIRNQAAILEYVTGEPAKNMLVWSGQVRSGDADNIEGRAAAFYWKNIFPDASSFVRGRFDEAPNNILNYGYAILRAVIARSLVASGLLPTLGIHHHNRYNAYCLADDVMEPYRPYVDRLVVDIVRETGLEVELTREIKARLLSVPVLDVVISGRRSPLMLAASQTTASLARCFSGESRRLVYPEM